jgi:hypothetical protein
VCIELAPFAGEHDLVGVGDRRRPVEALAECVVDDGVWRRVMARVDIPNQLTTLGDGDAALQDSRRGTLIQLAINRGE